MGFLGRIAFRVARIVLVAVAMWLRIAIANTNPYMNLPGEEKPVFLDCYEQAKWDGKSFVPTGKTICLGETVRK